MVVCIGNSVKVINSIPDQKGMRMAMLGGTWAHATLFDGDVVVNGTVYLHWTNSHGNRYKGKDRFDSPESGCWMTVRMLAQFCHVAHFVIYSATENTDKTQMKNQ